jgi:hypothetical protein
VGFCLGFLLQMFPDTPTNYPKGYKMKLDNIGYNIHGFMRKFVYYPTRNTSLNSAGNSTWRFVWISIWTSVVLSAQFPKSINQKDAR